MLYRKKIQSFLVLVFLLMLKFPINPKDKFQNVSLEFIWGLLVFNFSFLLKIIDYKNSSHNESNHIVLLNF